MAGENIMKITSIDYLRRLNLGNYEHEELKASALIGENDSAEICFIALKEFVENSLGIVKETKEQFPLPIVKEEPKIEETKAEETKAKEVKVEEEVKKKKERKPEIEKKPVKKISKATMYDRVLETHKSLIGAFLDTKYPKWRKNELIKKATQASKDLNGIEFLDENGEMLESFKIKFCEIMDS
jgi:hypothetical protein